MHHIKAILRWSDYFLTILSYLEVVRLLLNHLEVVKLLLENRADITIPNKDGRTPLNSASQNSHLRTVQLLLQSSSKVTPTTVANLAIISIYAWSVTDSMFNTPMPLTNGSSIIPTPYKPFENIMIGGSHKVLLSRCCSKGVKAETPP
ncbi:hypothetical protein P170DRAFT_420648 [Aspergillus steynii IBT 23096]|uniref:Uncharacterized protein n=1 Tax=Aspergillus steynii IBT 23096 TaxID=1392250 RepID=A0A2I2GLU7_9EURO|nr:uncharacterized protein P170DRAFT_420648 [Aspergillus steynii IBT 23096]PLB53843.1 hypothetical protein P170DRAFT_420648 [Aspergillus steynii IBT 23096]